MSRQADEHKGKGNGRSVRSSTTQKGNLISYNAPKEVVEELKKDVFGPIEALEVLDAFVSDGHRISIGANFDRGGYYVIIREGSVDWQKALSVSFWGKTLDRAIRLAGYYLKYVNEDFPNGVQLRFNETDW